MNLAVIIPAAGASRRYQLGQAVPRSKLDEDLGGRAVLQRTVELFTKHDAVGTIVVAGPAEPEAEAEFRARHADKLGLLGVKLCRGGVDHRWQTVAAALAHVPAEATHIAVHDAARPCLPAELLDRLLDASAQHPAVVPALEVADTLKRVAEHDAPADEDPLARILGAPAAGAPGAPRRWLVEATVPRDRLVAVQTPQVFDADLLRRAYSQADLASTDDAQLVERLGRPVLIIQGDPRNIKITLPADLPLARAILGVKDDGGRPAHKRF